jgi:DNA repair protein RecN (Recombination protein N)
MLIHLSIKNFAVVKQLEISFESGLTAITGETGAGKSIAIDALSLCLGERADAGAVRNNASKAEIIAHFAIDTLPIAKAWLQDNELAQDDEENTCFIRRIISKEGRSKAFINGTPVSLQQLKTFAQYLLAIHGQNTHLQLLKEDQQRFLLDSFADHASLQQQTNKDYKNWITLKREWSALQEAAQQRQDRQQLLTYQVAELDDFGLSENEFIDLEIEHKRLSHGQTLLEQAQTSFYNLYENDDINALSIIQSSINKLDDLKEHDSGLTPIVEMLNEALIQVEEASHELRDYCEQLEIDPLRLQQVEKRYGLAMELARKHGIRPENLYSYHEALRDELTGLSADAERLDELQQAVGHAQQAYLTACQALSASRQKAAKKLSTRVEQQIKQLNMPHAQVNIKVTWCEDKKPSSHGLDDIEIQVTTNPGQAMDRLDKVVSGGELSRIGLAFQVISSHQQAIPTLIFDEVDAGISGPTASVVGQLLRQLGKANQVLCVTHLPQVAAQAHNQLFVSKTTDGIDTQTQVLALTSQDRVDELARLLAGDKITASALANARELLDNVASN